MFNKICCSLIYLFFDGLYKTDARLVIENLIRELTVSCIVLIMKYFDGSEWEFQVNYSRYYFKSFIHGCTFLPREPSLGLGTKNCMVPDSVSKMFKE